jgi:hypothetical protein
VGVEVFEEFHSGEKCELQQTHQQSFAQSERLQSSFALLGLWQHKHASGLPVYRSTLSDFNEQASAFQFHFAFALALPLHSKI